MSLRYLLESLKQGPKQPREPKCRPQDPRAAEVVKHRRVAKELSASS